ncbi:redox-sensitive bicupin YhaK (pirin superfamily) [Paenibacillus sp. V4I9]|uniref:pirin family protein n=1 Tax=Paenibacillus sp. V4I9 TaxID=3042308 RepID=UPI0027830B22|nr:pirin family protein [Paenibacillus sp. V4I9]MDQ0885869.1 redox-sensitive bicupin YhaK (pirin superfamily) [Paenibacillus sp. V4I9]
MIKILQSHQSPTMGRGGPFQIRRMRPGKVYGVPAFDPAFGPLSVIDHATLRANNMVPMHEHLNDEILTYLISGKVTHEDSMGVTENITRRRLMLMNAGSGFSHEETNSGEDLEGLQIFVRPRDKDLPPGVQFYDRPVDYTNGTWQLVAGPEASDAPLKFRNQVLVFDIHTDAGAELEVPVAEGMSPFVYVMNGTVQVGNTTLQKGDAFTVTELEMPIMRTLSQAIIVAFLSDLNAAASKSGTISGGR